MCVCVWCIWFIVGSLFNHKFNPSSYFAFTCRRKVRKLPLHYTFPTVVNNGNTDADYFLLCLTKTQDVCHLNASSSNLRYNRLPMSEARNSNELIHNSNETILHSRANPWSFLLPMRASLITVFDSFSRCTWRRFEFIDIFKTSWPFMS